jgi:hypothetical protein
MMRLRVLAALALVLVRGNDQVEVKVHTRSRSPLLLHVENFATDAEMEHVIRKGLGDEGFARMKPEFAAAKGGEERGRPIKWIYGGGVKAANGLAFEIPVGGDAVLEGLYRRMSAVVPGASSYAPTFGPDPT